MVEKLARDVGVKWCLVVDNDERGVLFSKSLLEELTVVSSLSGVGFLVIVSITVFVVTQANLGRGRSITGLRAIELNLVAAVGGVVAVGVVAAAVVLGFRAFVRSASLDDETSLEL